MRVLDNVETQDTYVDDLTIEQEDASSLLLIVANKSVKARLRPSRRPSGGDQSYGNDLTFTPQTIPIFGVNGVQVRSLEPGVPARVIAVLAAEDEPQLTAGIPFLERLTGEGQLGGVEGELAFVEFVAPVAINQNTEGAAVTVVATGNLELEAGDRIKLEFFCPKVTPTSATDLVGLFTENGNPLGQFRMDATDTSPGVSVTLYRTPGAGTFAYAFKAFRSSGAGAATVDAGAGVSGDLMPGFIRVSTSPQ